MSTLSDDIWCKYAEGIKNWAGKSGKPDPNSVYYIASAVNKGPAAGSFVPDANMNFTLSQLCDALISSSSPVYNPGTDGSYFDNLQRYIAAVKLQENVEQGLEQQLKEANEAAAKALKAYAAARTDATNEWTKDDFSGKGAGVDLQTWATSNAPLLFTAQSERDARAQHVTQINSRIFGPGAAKLTNQQNLFIQAGNRTLSVTGLNMKVTDTQISTNDYRKYIDAVRDGTIGSLPPMVEQPGYFVPSYATDPTFKATMDEWLRVPIDADPEYKWTIKSEDTKHSDWTKVGHEEGTGGFNFGWIRIGGGGSKDWKDSKVVDETGSFEIQLSAQRCGLFNIYPGAWNVKQFRHTYPNTIGEVDLAKDAVQPTQLFCASRVKLRVKFTGSIKNSFESAVKEVKGGSGGISILGFTVGGGGGSTEETTTHDSDLVETDGWYEIKPTLVSGGCSMLAVIGNKFNA